MKKVRKRLLAIMLSASIIAGSIELPGLLGNRFNAATVNDKTLEEFTEEVSSLYDDTEISEMGPDLVFSKDSDNVVIGDSGTMVPVKTIVNATDFYRKGEK